MASTLSDPPDIARLRQDLHIDATLHGRAMSFRTTWGLFSPRGVDDGTALLLDHFEAGEADRTFDLGCGWGAIGLTLAGDSPNGHVTMVDRDVLAVHYAGVNARLNAVENVTIRAGNAFDDEPPENLSGYDNIVSNLPAKMGGEGLTLLLYDAWRHLRPGGRICVVTVTGLRRFIERHLRQRFGNYDKLKQNPRYTIASAMRS